VHFLRSSCPWKKKLGESKEKLGIDRLPPNFYIRINLFFGERRERGCPAMNIGARNVIRNLLPCSASESTMLGRRNAQNVVGKDWNNSSPVSR
jgi:hypothetical protein